LGHAIASIFPSLRPATSAGEVIGFIIIERTLGEAAMPSSPAGFDWACAGLANENRAMPASAEIRLLFIVFIFVLLWFVLMFFYLFSLIRHILLAIGWPT
jgi:hypothetical protein